MVLCCSSESTRRVRIYQVSNVLQQYLAENATNGVPLDTAGIHARCAVGSTCSQLSESQQEEALETEMSLRTAIAEAEEAEINAVLPP